MQALCSQMQALCSQMQPLCSKMPSNMTQVGSKDTRLVVTWALKVHQGTQWSSNGEPGGHPQGPKPPMWQPIVASRGVQRKANEAKSLKYGTHLTQYTAIPGLPCRDDQLDHNAIVQVVGAGGRGEALSCLCGQPFFAKGL